MANQVVWFDIPVRDLDRAIKFYSAVLGVEVERQEFEGGVLAMLPHKGESGEVGGCLFSSKDATPGATGPLLYLNAQGRLDAAVAAVEPNGGKVQEAKHQIGPYGFRALVLDSEGNRIALHSM